VDRALRTIGHRRATLDAEEARWLREAEALQIWRPLGMVSAIDYMERVLGYGPRAAQERLRVARALGALPELTAALSRGELSFSAVRELTRVATPSTEAAWRDAAAGKNLRQLEELVADHRPGDHPDDPVDPEVRTRVVRWELSAETFALLRQTRGVLDDERGRHQSDDELVAALCGAVLDGTAAIEPTGRAKFQIAMVVCERCRQGWQEGAGARIAVGAASVERAMCDAQHIGSIEGGSPERAYQDVAPSVVRFVWRRDGGRCRAPGCRSARGLDIHHLVHRADGGGHDAGNLALLCGSCHLAHHRGSLTITGTAERLEVRRNAGPDPSVLTSAHVGAGTVASAVNKLDDAIVGAAARPGTVASAASKVDDAIVGAAPRTTTVANAANKLDETSAHVGATGRTGTVASAANKLDETSAHVCAAARTGTVASAANKLDETSAHVGAAARTGTVASAAAKLDDAIVGTQAKEALIGLGWKAPIAQAAVAAARGALGDATTLERLILEALRRCPRPGKPAEGSRDDKIECAERGPAGG
jgi:hypothetical protein